MGEVIELRPRAAARIEDTKGVLTGMMAQDTSGELVGAICIAGTRQGTEIHLTGNYTDRLQNGVLALVKGLNFVVDKIVATGTAGDTPSDAKIVSFGIPNPRSTLPKRLREVTGFGDLR